MTDTVRRGHLVFSSGVGGLTILKNGTSVVCAGLDYWFRDDKGEPAQEVINANRVSDWRLEARVRVSELRTPPAAPEGSWRWSKSAEPRVGIPFLRFPLWHVCPNPGCRRLTLVKNTSSQELRCERCPQPSTYKPRLVQVPLVAACRAGHLEEFPWQIWLKGCDCEEPRFRLRQSGGSGLANFILSCEACGRTRSMAGALTESGLKPCGGARPWLGPGAAGVACTNMLIGVLRNSASVYYSNVVSSVYIPREGSNVPEDLRELLENNNLVSYFLGLNRPLPDLIELLRTGSPAEYKTFSDEQLLGALGAISTDQQTTSIIPDELDYRFAEFDVLRKPAADERLRVRTLGLDSYSLESGLGIRSVSLVDSLTVTKVLAGFGRLVPGVSWDAHQSESQLWRRPPSGQGQRWLPAVQVRGEGVFLHFDEERMVEWENREDVKSRVSRLAAEAEGSRYVSSDLGSIGARFLLLHTISHLLMNRMVFEAGYSATSLSERIYSREPTEDSPGMAAVLIYTASGDAEGSLGGLVRLGRPGQFENLLLEAIESARWCSSDPICMELGGSEGQGPDGLNLAACHSCVHVPETACERFNVLMDRALVAGSLDQSDLGFFSRV